MSSILTASYKLKIKKYSDEQPFNEIAQSVIIKSNVFDKSYECCEHLINMCGMCFVSNNKYTKKSGGSYTQHDNSVYESVPNITPSEDFYIPKFSTFSYNFDNKDIATGSNYKYNLKFISKNTYEGATDIANYPSFVTFDVDYSDDEALTEQPNIIRQLYSTAIRAKLENADAEEYVQNITAECYVPLTIILTETKE